jgi:hypothetical protein
MGVTTISIAKAMKLKNRLAGRLAKTQEDIQTFNSVLESEAGKVDIQALLDLRTKLVQALSSLKIQIFRASEEVRANIVNLGEAKASLTFYQGIPTAEGERQLGYGSQHITKQIAHLKKADVDKAVKEWEIYIDKLQDTLDAFNATTQIEISESTLSLAS